MRGIKHRVSNIKREYLESLQVDVDKGSLLIQVPSGKYAANTALLIAVGTKMCVTTSVAVHRGHGYPPL